MREHLAPFSFQPGQSGNPSGRPKKNPISDYTRAQLEMEVPEAMLAKLKMREALHVICGPNPTFGQFVAFKQIQMAMAGDASATREVLERTEGKVAQKMDFGGEVAVVKRVVSDL